MSVVTHQSPDCATSRRTSAIIRAAGLEPTVIDDVQTGWTKAQLQGRFAADGSTPCKALRVARSPTRALGLTAPDVPDEALLAAMADQPILVHRPILCTHKGARLRRPSEAGPDLLDAFPPGLLTKEDGQLRIEDRGNRSA